MKKKTKKNLLALISCMITVLLLGMTVFAADYKITITNGTNDEATHTFEAYQIFAGTVYGTGENKVLSNVVWGEGVDSDALMTFLHGSADYNTVITSSITTAEALAKILADGSFPGGATNFADVVSNYLTTASASGSSELNVNSAGPGYYLIKDKDGSLSAQNNAAYTDFMLQVLGDVTITAKAEVPTIDKKIVEGSKTVEANVASIGDKINYQITSAVPAMTGYEEKYFFVVEDTLGDGLTFNDDVAVEIEGYTGTVDVQVKKSGQKFTVVFKNFIQYKALAGKAITITYSATLNQNAVVGGLGGNPNTARLTYSNNPNIKVTSTSDEPSSDDPVGKTPEIKTVTYTTKVHLTKVDGETFEKLAGAKFTISGEATQVTMINGKIYQVDASGTYYMLKDGSFSTTKPTEEQGDPTVKYSEVTVVDMTTSTLPINASAYTNATGDIEFTGISSGSFVIHEDEAPSGYNSIGDVTVTVTAEPTLTGCTWTVTSGNAVVDNGVIELEIENNKGIHMPETGGMGTVLFYLIGAVLVLLAVTLVITKRRVSNKEF